MKKRITLIVSMFLLNALLTSSCAPESGAPSSSKNAPSSTSSPGSSSSGPSASTNLTNLRTIQPIAGIPLQVWVKKSGKEEFNS
jgi:hypothetical protein